MHFNCPAKRGWISIFNNTIPASKQCFSYLTPAWTIKVLCYMYIYVYIRSLHATEIVLKTQFQWHALGCTGQLTTRLECTGGNFNTCVCVNVELRPSAGDIHIPCFNVNALAQGNACKPTKEPINFRGPGGDRAHDLQTEATILAASCPARWLHATEIVSKTHTHICTYHVFCINIHILIYAFLRAYRYILMHYMDIYNVAA